MNPIAETVAQTILHFLWQGTALGLLAAVVLSLIKRSAPNTRYVVACFFFLAMALAPAITFGLIAMPEARPSAGSVFRFAPAVSATYIPGTPEPAWLSRIFLAWLIGVAALSLRTAGGWIFVMCRFRANRKAPSVAILQTAARLATKLGIRDRAVRIYESTLATVPATYGAIRPVVILPAAAILNLGSEQLEAILAHEMAHIARHDFLINCLQTAVETLLFYHPAVWWLSRVIRHEREVCCDSIAVGFVGDRVLYSRALLALEEARHSLPAPAMAATSGDLRDRIQRLIAPEATQRTSFVPALLVLTALLTGGATAALHAQSSPYDKWLNEDVVYIVSSAERTAFQNLKTDEERQRFIQQFWDVRGGTAIKEEHYRRIMYSNERYPTGIPGWKTDRGRIYILNGPPSEIESHPDGPREHWRYADGRQFDFSGPNFTLTRKDGPVVFKRFNVEHLPEPQRSQLRSRLAQFTGKPMEMSNELMQAIQREVESIQTGLRYMWRVDKDLKQAWLELDDKPMAEPPGAPDALPPPPPPPPPPPGA